MAIPLAQQTNTCNIVVCFVVCFVCMPTKWLDSLQHRNISFQRALQQIRYKRAPLFVTSERCGQWWTKIRLSWDSAVVFLFYQTFLVLQSQYKTHVLQQLSFLTLPCMTKYKTIQLVCYYSFHEAFLLKTYLAWQHTESL